MSVSDLLFYKYNMAYVTDPDYVEKFLDEFTSYSQERIKFEQTGTNCEFLTLERNGITIPQTASYFTSSPTLKLAANEIQVTLEAFNAIYNIEEPYTSVSQINLADYKDKPIHLTIKLTLEKELSYEGDFIVGNVSPTSTAVSFRLPRANRELAKLLMCSPKYLITNPTYNRGYLDLISKQAVTIGGSNPSMLREAGRIMAAFTDVFKTISVVLFLAIICVICLTSSNMIKHNRKFIGIMKCYGCRNKDLTTMFFSHTTTNSMIMAGATVGVAVVCTILANKFLEFGISNFTASEMSGLGILTINWANIAICAAIGILSFAIAYLLPMILIRKVDPIKSVAAKE